VMSGTNTVGAVMQSARDRLHSVSESAGLDAQLLLEFATGFPREQLLAHPEQKLTPYQERTIEDLVRQYLAGSALPYLLGWWEFYGRRFIINPHVLIPRPETELLVELALSFLQPRKPARFLDVGTGSGIIAITLLLEHAGSTAVASDHSLDALKVAQKNRDRYSLGNRLDLVQASLAEGLGSMFDLVCANLPYIPSAKLADLPVARREPREALDGGEDGLDLIRQLLDDLPRIVSRDGSAILEIEEGQGGKALTYAKRSLPGCVCRIQQDLAGKDRLLIVTGF